MSHSCSPDIVDFVVHNVFEQDSDVSLEYLPEDEVMILDPDAYDEVVLNPKNIIQLNGWTHYTYDSSRDKIGKKKELFGSYWEKNNLHVWSINESQYNSVGEYSIAIISDDEKSIIEFLKDFNKKGTIEKNEIVESWG